MGIFISFGGREEIRDTPPEPIRDPNLVSAFSKGGDVKQCDIIKSGPFLRSKWQQNQT